MNKFIALILVLFLIGCAPTDISETQVTEPDAVEPQVVTDTETVVETPDETVSIDREDLKSDNKAELIAVCDSLCENDADAYCSEMRTLYENGEETKGTCRGFARKGAVEGFNKCEGFCKEYDKSGTELQ